MVTRFITSAALAISRPIRNLFRRRQTQENEDVPAEPVQAPDLPGLALETTAIPEVEQESPLDSQKCRIECDNGDHLEVGNYSVVTVKVWIPKT
jgi:hypothetical protein